MERIDYTQIEIDILRIAASGEIMTPNQERFREFLAKYPEDHQQAITCVMMSLQAQGFLIPLYNDEGQPNLRGWSRGLTPNGHRHLNQMEHPMFHWLTSNWFPATIATVNILIGAGAIITSTL